MFDCAKGSNGYRFPNAEQRESNFERDIRTNCHQRRKLFMVYLTVKSFNQQLQFLVKLRMKEVVYIRYIYVYMFLITVIISWNFDTLYASLTTMLFYIILFNLEPFLT
jgi:hypothetical protein